VEALSIVELTAGALLFGVVAFIIALVIGASPLLVLLITAAGAAVGAWYGARLLRLFRRQNRM
jgi:uncharacterized membrane protein YfcA